MNFKTNRPFFGRGQIALNADDAIEFGGVTYRPDDTKAYVKFEISFAFPNVNNYGDGIHAAVINRSWRNILGGSTSSNHRVEAYGSTADEFMGAILAANYGTNGSASAEATARQATPKNKADAPFISGVAAIWKTAAPTMQWLERFDSKRKNVSVSMEIFYEVAQGGFALSRNGDEKLDIAQTPAEMWEAGWEYVPMANLLTPEQMTMKPDDLVRSLGRLQAGTLLATRDWKAKRMRGGDLMGSGLVGSWAPAGSGKPREVYYLQGGVADKVSYAGIGIVELGAEKRANVVAMLAGIDEDEAAAAVAGKINDLSDEIGAIAKR